MSFYRYPLLPITALAAVVALSACSSSPKQPPSASSAAVTTSPAVIDEISALLDRGEVRSAKQQLAKELKRDPMNPSLMVLLQGLEGDAKADLGEASYAYKVKPGETMGELAERFLGNRLKSYQLARYNDIDVPADLPSGQQLRIPGRADVRAPAPRVAKPKAPPPAASASRETPKSESRPAPPPARPATNPAAAQRARAAGLAALNRGKVANAVTLLRQAAALDPSSSAIARDLARAERIAATVRTRR